MGTNRNASPEALHHARPHGGAIVDLQIEVRHAAAARPRKPARRRSPASGPDIAQQHSHHRHAARRSPMPPGESTRPLSIAVYPSSVCRNSGSSAVLPYSTKPSTSMETVASVKLRSFRMWKSMIGCFWRNSQNTTAIRQTTVIDGERHDEVRGEPVFLLAFVQHHFERAQTQRQQTRSPCSRSSSRLPKPLRTRYGGSKISSAGQHQRQDADRNIDVGKSSASE